jgi:SAM-dependent methyltransferase
MTHDEVRRIVEQHWDREVEAGCGYTVPALSLSRELIEEYIAGRRDDLPGIEDALEPCSFLAGVEGKEVLCLASGGGQQSVIFGLLGAHVTVLDICEGQLEADRTAACHYGYEVKAVKGDACDLSAFADDSFDLVYQPGGINWMPEVRPVYREVYRVLRPGGSFRIAIMNPAVLLAEWDGSGYRIGERYKGGPVLRNSAGIENMEEGEPTGDHRHLFRDSLGGLLEVGFVIHYLGEVPRALRNPLLGEPGSWAHAECFLGVELDVVAEKAAR